MVLICHGDNFNPFRFLLAMLPESVIDQAPFIVP